MCGQPATPWLLPVSRYELKQCETVWQSHCGCFQHWIIILLQVTPLFFLVPDLQGQFSGAPLHYFFKQVYPLPKPFYKIEGLQQKKHDSHGKRRAGFYEKQILCGVKELLEE